MVETQFCKLRDTSDMFVGRAYSIFHLYYGVCELTYHMVNIQFHIFCGRSKKWRGILPENQFPSFKRPRRSYLNPIRIFTRFFCEILFFCSSYTVPSTIERQKHALEQTQTSRTKACSQVHTIQVHMTSSSLFYFVFCESPTLSSLPLSISGQGLYRRERPAWRSNVGIR